MLAYCKFNGIGVIPWAPIAAGALAHPLEVSTTRTESSKGTPMEATYTDADKIIISRVEEVAGKKGWTMAQVALAWVAGKITSPIVGTSSVKRLDENIVTGFALTEEESKYLEEPYVSSLLSYRISLIVFSTDTFPKSCAGTLDRFPFSKSAFRKSPASPPVSESLK